MAPKHGMDGLESHFARTNLELANSEQEEVYVVVSGSARFAGGDEVVEAAQWDAVRVSPGVRHGMEAGPDGAELVAFGAPNTENKDAEVQPGWWPEG